VGPWWRAALLFYSPFIFVESACIIPNTLELLNFLFRSAYSAAAGASHGPHAKSVLHRASDRTRTHQSMLSTRLAAAARLRPALARLSSSASSKAAVPAEAQPVPAVVPQSPNHAATWSANQRPRPAGQSGPRFEQTTMELQPNPLSAMELIANEPIRLTLGRKAVCDGGKSTS
jgi:NADH dehydrogenase (ubiquinone) Fe-S protein 6